MEISQEDAKNVIEQLQQAHRISVAFYRRILPTLDVIADQFGCSFYYWEPLFTNRPGRGKSQPSEYWAWDFVPLYASSHTYRYINSEKRTVPEDLGIIFNLCIDNSFSDEACRKGQPDPISLPIGEAVLKAYLYRPKRAVNKSFDVLWEEEEEVRPEIGKWSSINEYWNGIAFEWPLAEVIHNNQLVINTLQKHIR